MGAIDWLARARELLMPPPTPTDETDETPLSSVLSVRGEAVCEISATKSVVTRNADRVAPATSCKGCAHQLRHGTCGSPVEAGLADTFVIVWAPENHAGTCTARKSTSPAKGDSRPHKLTKAAADAAHAIAWDQGAIARFLAREARLIRLGFDADGAGDLAENAHLRDVTGDDRTCCWQCRHLRHWRCRQHQRAGLSAPEIGRDLAVLPQRCPAVEVTA
jgi:hypothetical protein